MGRKKLPYWLKTGFTLVLVIFAISFVGLHIPFGILLYFLLIIYPLESLGNLFGSSKWMFVSGGLLPNIFGFILLIIIYFIIGAIIGWIYGKMKNRSQNAN